jgi:hypothetical protein
MLKRDITYTDFDGEEITESFYFNLMKSELVELEAGHRGGLDEFIRRIMKTEDHQALISEFKRLILLAYGQKSDDGKRFIKTEQMREEFSQTSAYDVLFMELATNDEAAAVFLKGVLPKEIQEEVARQDAEQAQQLARPNIQPAENLARNQKTQENLPPPPSIVETEATDA